MKNHERERDRAPEYEGVRGCKNELFVSPPLLSAKTSNFDYQNHLWKSSQSIYILRIGNGICLSLQTSEKFRTKSQNQPQR